ncbi:MAG: hypothetical protein IJ575_11545 [Selenomonadaceae bacterium]|nr:hypothetical protein [Selenomonadaceae bacterium]
MEKYTKPNILLDSQVNDQKGIIPIAGASLTALAVGAAVFGMMKKASPRGKKFVPLQKK